MNDDSEPRDVDQEWEDRILCSDESCIGTIGPDGRCRECGRPYEGILPSPTESNRIPEAAAAGDAKAVTSGESHAAVPGSDDAITENAASGADDEWEHRTLCPDEGCIGVIGPDGRCKECGMSL
jgi:hypothetical protein